MAIMETRLRYKIRFYRHYWKLGVHLVFKTRHFGVNNHWWAREPSVIAWPWWRRLLAMVTLIPLIQNYQSMKVRACIGWMPFDQCHRLGFDN